MSDQLPLKSFVKLSQQLIIVDVQQYYSQFGCSEKLASQITEYAKNFDSILYIYNETLHMQPHCDMFPVMWNSTMIKKMVTLPKSAGFLRPLMGRVSKHEVLSLLPALESGDSKSVDIKYRSALNQCKWPTEFVANLKRHSRPTATLVGGGLHECLEEVNLLLTHIGVQTSVNSELTYEN